MPIIEDVPSTADNPIPAPTLNVSSTTVVHALAAFKGYVQYTYHSIPLTILLPVLVLLLSVCSASHSRRVNKISSFISLPEPVPISQK